MTSIGAVHPAIRPKRSYFLLIPLLIFVVMGCEERTGEGQMDQTNKIEETMQEMPAMEAVPDSLRRMALAPLVPAYYKGEEAFFIHTETSNRQVAEMLTKMMGPEVVYVPQLADVQESLLTPIYVFENGVEGTGPFGYQRDILTSVPDTEDYSPLRQIYLVTWNEEAEPRVLRSAEAVQQAIEQDLLSVERTDRIVNAPVLAWPGGHR